MDFLDFIKKFVEGDISVEQFQSEVIGNEGFQKYLDSRVEGLQKYLEESGNSLWVYMACLDTENIRDRYEMHKQAVKLLKGVPFVPTEKYKNEFELTVEMSFATDYIDCPQITEKIIRSLPAVSVSRKKKLLKQQLKELFIYDEKPPVWIQNPEWQLRDGKPMKFRAQYKTDDGYRYEFYDDEGVISIEQYY